MTGLKEALYDDEADYILENVQDGLQSLHLLACFLTATKHRFAFRSNDPTPYAESRFGVGPCAAAVGSSAVKQICLQAICRNECPRPPESGNSGAPPTELVKRKKTKRICRLAGLCILQCLKLSLLEACRRASQCILKSDALAAAFFSPAQARAVLRLTAFCAWKWRNSQQPQRSLSLRLQPVSAAACR